jgi:hypothetical protein
MGTFRPKKKEVAGGCRRLQYEEPHNLYTSPNLIRMIKSRRGVGHVVRMGEMGNVCKILVGEPKGKRLMGKHRRRWEDNIVIDLREIGWGGMNWLHLTQDKNQRWALVNTVMNLQVP